MNVEVSSEIAPIYVEQGGEHEVSAEIAPICVESRSERWGEQRTCSHLRGVRWRVSLDL